MVTLVSSVFFKVYLDGKRLELSDFKGYCDMYMQDSDVKVYDKNGGTSSPLETSVFSLSSPLVSSVFYYLSHSFRV